MHWNQILLVQKLINERNNIISVIGIKKKKKDYIVIVHIGKEKHAET
jgi:hypothetical protein